MLKVKHDRDSFSCHSYRHSVRTIWMGRRNLDPTCRFRDCKTGGQTLVNASTSIWSDSQHKLIVFLKVVDLTPWLLQYLQLATVVHRLHNL